MADILCVYVYFVYCEEKIDDGWKRRRKVDDEIMQLFLKKGARVGQVEAARIFLILNPRHSVACVFLPICLWKKNEKKKEDAGGRLHF